MHVGIDLISINRVENLLKYDRYLARVFSQAELGSINSYPGIRKAKRLAGKFAGKEATLKAMGAALGEIDLRDIQVLHDKNGKPCLMLTGDALAMSKVLHTKRHHISISHDKQYAIAMVILE